MAGIDPDTQAFDYDVEDDESDDDDVDDDAVDGLPSRFEGEDLEELAEQTRLSLETGALPDYHHIRAVVLLAFIVEYCCHPENRRSEAETLRAWSRRFHPEGLDASVDAVLADLRRMLDSIDEVLKSEKSTYDSEDDDMQPVCDDMGDLEDADEVLWAEQDDPQELIHAGEEALAVTSEFEEKMRIGEGRARVCLKISACLTKLTIAELRFRRLKNRLQAIAAHHAEATIRGRRTCAVPDQRRDVSVSSVSATCRAQR